MRIFKCNFGDGISCEVHIADEPPEKGTQHVQAIEWTGRPTSRVIRPYVAWMNSVNKTMADEWNVTLMHIYMVSETKNECWVFRPGKPPLLDKDL